MATSNISQLLLRNINEISAANPLFVNLTDDGFITEYLSHHSQANITCYHTNFADYQLSQSIADERVQSHFCAEYQTPLSHDLVIMTFPKSKAEYGFTLAMLANSVTKDATIIIVGENKSGIKSADKLGKDYLRFCNKIDAARHCLLYVARFKTTLPDFVLADFYHNYQLEIADQTIKIAALPGVFSQNKLDIGTQVLLDNLPETITGKVLDFGCGAGVIAAYISTLFPESKPTLVDVNALALQSAKKTFELNQLKADFIASNSLSRVTDSYDYVISNPPFHQGVKTHYAATEQFLMKIKQHIKPNGCITIVANSFLKYPPIMEQAIGTTKTITVTKGFAIYQCLNRTTN